MKICFVSFLAYPLFNKDCVAVFGGAEVQLFNLAQALSSEQSVSFVVGDFGQPEKETYREITLLRSVRLGNKYGFIEKVRSVLAQFAAMKRSGADIFVKRAAGPEVAVTALYSLLFRKKFVYMAAHEIDCSGEYRKNNPLLGFLYEFGLRLADLVITQNQYQQELLKKNYHRDSVVLESGYPIPRPRENGGCSILWVARLDTWKQPEIFLDLARSFPQNSFTLIGPPAHDHAYEQSIQDAAKEISNLRFIGGVPFAETDTYFQQAKIFINTSLYEGFPNTFVQAMMHGVPILSLTVDPDAFLEKNEVGYCAKNNLTAMKSLLEALLKDDALHQRISARAYRYAADHHDIRKTSQKFLTLLEECYAQ